MFGWIATGIGALAGITSGIKQNEAAKEQAAQAEAQALAMAQQRAVQGAMEMGNLELSMAMSGVAMPTQSVDGTDTVGGAQDTASLIYNQSEQNIQTDITNIIETGQYYSDAYKQAGKTNLFENVFGAVSNTVGYGALSVNQYRNQGYGQGYGNWLTTW